MSMDPEKEQLRLLVLIDQWDRLSAEQKWAEWDRRSLADGGGSIYEEVPGFAPQWCSDCMSHVFLDFSNGADGACPIDATHAIS